MTKDSFFKSGRGCGCATTAERQRMMNDEDNGSVTFDGESVDELLIWNPFKDDVDFAKD